MAHLKNTYVLARSIVSVIQVRKHVQLHARNESQRNIRGFLEINTATYEAGVTTDYVTQNADNTFDKLNFTRPR